MKKYQHYIDVQGEVLQTLCGTTTAVATSYLNYREMVSLISAQIKG